MLAWNRVTRVLVGQVGSRWVILPLLAPSVVVGLSALSGWGLPFRDCHVITTPDTARSQLDARDTSWAFSGEHYQSCLY